ncbi:hypothetical protein Athai_03010 [Actinocatenispora thailandica]|uniref:Uncharacterized protein n=1 Tax=Actinocatenispora thailandica TaxID=227318 RepID=A0A7R7HV29_9ACTN|nr:hypothetical protein [Actinocatenispora thailandica]BCJ32798.1 hypothetical protein Athai_03010 [Actinocatenispora thailandica]
MGDEASNQSSAFGFDKPLMKAASDGCLAAAAMEVAPAVMIKFMFTLSAGDAAAVDKAGQDWRQASALVRQAAEAFQQAVAGVSGDDWTAQDRDAYEKKVREACEQYQVVEIYLEAAGIALSVMAGALCAYAVFAAGMAIALIAIGVAILACEGTVVGSVAVPELEAAAAVCLEITQVATGILAEVGVAIAEVLQGGAVLDATAEEIDGNDKAFGDLLNGEAVGAAAAGANLLQNAANAGIAYANMNEKTPALGKDGQPVIGPDGKPELNEGKTKFGDINLNADRDWDKTWDVGASGKYGDFSAGADVKYGDHGWQGASVSGGYTPEEGPQVTGNAGWEQDADGNNVYKGDLTGGYKSPDGSTYSGTASGEYDDNADGSHTYSGGVTGKYENEYSGASADAGVNGSYTHGADGSSTYSGGVSASAGDTATGESVHGGASGTDQHDADGSNHYSATGTGGYTTPYGHGDGSLTGGYDQHAGGDDSVYTKAGTEHGGNGEEGERHEHELRYDPDSGRVTRTDS